jgi:hypothetical protein
MAFHCVEGIVSAVIVYFHVNVVLEKTVSSIHLIYFETYCFSMKLHCFFRTISLLLDAQNIAHNRVLQNTIGRKTKLSQYTINPWWICFFEAATFIREHTINGSSFNFINKTGGCRIAVSANRYHTSWRRLMTVSHKKHKLYEQSQMVDLLSMYGSGMEKRKRWSWIWSSSRNGSHHQQTRNGSLLYTRYGKQD